VWPGSTLVVAQGTRSHGEILLKRSMWPESDFIDKIICETGLGFN
jgi:hypothetical protein